MKKKMDLNQLKVTSFITNLDKQTELTVKGGISGNNPGCPQKWTKEKGCTWESELYTACRCETERGITCYDELPVDRKAE